MEATAGTSAYHLNVLERAGIIRSSRVTTKDGSYTVYEVTHEGKRIFGEFLEALRGSA